MFKIAKTGLSQPRQAAPPLDGSGHELLHQYCFSEAWSGELTSGLFRFGEMAQALHGLEHAECGLLNLVRLYDSTDRNDILGLFEQAATHASAFCFSTTLFLESGRKQPIFCIGESIGLEQRYAGTITGVFFFPRFQLETRARFFDA